MNNLLRCKFCLNLVTYQTLTQRSLYSPTKWLLQNGHMKNFKTVRQINMFTSSSPYKKVSRFKLFNISYRRSTSNNGLEGRHKTVLLYLSSAAVLACGLSYAAVPLYRLYCQVMILLLVIHTLCVNTTKFIYLFLDL